MCVCVDPTEGGDVGVTEGTDAGGVEGVDGGATVGVDGGATEGVDVGVTDGAPAGLVGVDAGTDGETLVGRGLQLPCEAEAGVAVVVGSVA